MPTLPPDFIPGVIGFLLTLMILSYLIGDNPLYRIASYIFVGVSAGYIASVAFWQVIMPKLILPFRDGTMLDRALLVVPLLFSGLIMMKISPRLSRLSSPAMGYLVGVGAALAIGGALSATLIPQFFSSIFSFPALSSIGDPVSFEALIEGGIALLGTVTTLAYFQYGAGKQKEDGSVRRNGLVELIAWIGGLFIAVTLGVIFAGVLSAAFTALIERLNSMLSFILSLIGLA